MAKQKSVIEGVSDELNKIASQNLDFAPSRRRVRSAFAEVQQQLDHCLFKVLPLLLIEFLYFDFSFAVITLSLTDFDVFLFIWTAG